MIDNQPNKPSYQNKAYQSMSAGWKVVRDVARGTLHMREQGGDYLPKFPAEHDQTYRERLSVATLFNAYNRTVQGLVGMVFKKNPVLNEDVPPDVRTHAENIDLAGTHLDVFAKDVLTDAFDGHAFILVDMQKGLGPGATLADERRLNRRPYWVKYRADQAINFRPALINNQLEIGQITFEETALVPDGPYGEKEEMRYRTFRLEEVTDERTGERSHRVQWELQHKTVNDRNEEVFVILDGGTISQSRIPVAVVCGKKTGFLTSQPPLLDLALTNIKYYQKRSDYDASLHLCGNPIPAGIGIPDEWNLLAVGSGRMLRLPQGADLKYVEPTGAALEATRVDLQDVRAEMAALGLSVLASSPDVATTATETIIDFTQESSELATIARSLSDGIELALQFHAAYLNLGSGGSISLGSDLRNFALSPQQITVYSNMVAANQLSVESLWSLLQRGDVLSDDFDAETEKQRIREQQKNVGEALLRSFDRDGETES